jgi:hypothetical protein
MIIIILIICDRMCPAYITYLGDCAANTVDNHRRKALAAKE